MTERILIIGAGPAGMMAAISAAEAGCTPILLERNDRPGRKLMITGKGRCNITNDCAVNELIASVPVNSRFLYGAFSRFSPQDMMAFCRDHGLPVKTERGNRVFPVSDKAQDVVDLLHHRCNELGCIRMTGRAVKIFAENGTITGVETDEGQLIEATRVILATGGASYPGTGSTGDGYAMARALGHTVVAPVPSLIPLTAEGKDCTDMMGLSLRNTGLRIEDIKKHKIIYTDFGEMLFTHFGVSGPMILSGSAHLRPMEPGRYVLHLDLKPALSEEQLDARLLREVSASPNRHLGNLMGALLPAKMIPVFLRRSGIDPSTPVHQISREMRKQIIALLKDFTVAVHGFRPLSEAIVTSGGISVKEISPKTMESKLVRGLYFCGEVIDVDAYTGGFNLQIAWSTGRLAGESAAAACFENESC